jgi:hypothetical protein
LQLTLFRRKDAIDIYNFAEYEVMAKKIIDEAPSKLSVFFSLDDVKAAAARVGFLQFIMKWLAEFLYRMDPIRTVRQTLRQDLGLTTALR